MWGLTSSVPFACLLLPANLSTKLILVASDVLVFYFLYLFYFILITHKRWFLSLSLSFPSILLSSHFSCLTYFLPPPSYVSFLSGSSPSYFSLSSSYCSSYSVNLWFFYFFIWRTIVISSFWFLVWVFSESMQMYFTN